MPRQCYSYMGSVVGGGQRDELLLSVMAINQKKQQNVDQQTIHWVGVRIRRERPFESVFIQTVVSDRWHGCRQVVTLCYRQSAQSPDQYTESRQKNSTRSDPKQNVSECLHL